jgi:raffinose/stachyose/melibiose transport system substrate-binding protein
MPENLKAKRTEYAIEGAESRSCLKDSLAVSKQFPAPSEYLTIVQGE